MATNPHMDRSDDPSCDDKGDKPSTKDSSREDEQETSKRSTNPRFQRLVDEAGERFRKALDRLA